ncbi:endonuclease/exonuclease/phosphatase family protein [Phytoactinopolyspora endophytica]|uniref:endonuclease/exonuclease/phosphatase family protein n=1 Tax=Phytoactinopolyspora endophytica TaxID=1642495 RepID=UPI00101D39A7|nr:endonuclease/exonuclease/phosphatase family protein [Phytoactinopolyspora endophytica]
MKRSTAVMFACTVLTLLATGASALPAVGPEPPPATSTESSLAAGMATVKVITYNLCGAAAHCDNPGEILDRTGYVIDEVLAYDADVVLLTEVCYLQYAHMRDELADNGYSPGWVAAYGRVNNCTPPGGNTETLASENKLRFGQVMFAKNSLTAREDIPLSATNYGVNAIIKAMCYDLDVGGLGQGTARACVAQTRSGASGPGARARWEQNATLAAEVDRYLLGNDQAVILGGDFNAEPADDEIDMFYELDGIGAFVEADMTDADHFSNECLSQQLSHCRSGAPTYGTGTATPKKIDYIFFSADHASNLDAEVRPIGPNSDHHLLRGSATISLSD